MITQYLNLKIRKYIITSLCLLFVSLVFAQSGIYVGGHFRRDSLVTVPALKNSGFTYVILFNVQVETNGDLTMDNVKICSNGVCTFASCHPNYINDVTALRTGLSSVQRVEKCIGGWGSKSYDNIKTLVKLQGTSDTTILYRNFKALREAIPEVEAINNDDEQTYDIETASAFHIMLYDLGYKTTITPYMNKIFWQNFVNKVNAARPGAVDRIDLQCYDGGSGNKDNPNAWLMGNIPLHAGLLHFETSSNINVQMKKWKTTSSVVGGFLWVYNANDFNLQNHAKAICSVFLGGEVVFVSKMRPHATLFSQKNFQGDGVTFEVGRFTEYAIASQKFKIADLLSVKIHEGFIIELFEGDSLKGKSTLLSADVLDLSQLGLSTVSSCKIIANGDKTLAGKTYYLKNRKSGMYLSLDTESITDGVTLTQKEYTGANSQKWVFNHIYNGTYNITNQFSKKTIQIKDFSDAEDGLIEQGIYKQAANQRSVVLNTSVKGVYKIISEQSVKYFALESGREITSGAKVTQTEKGESESAYWILEDASLSGIESPAKNMQIISPNIVVNNLFINEDIKNISRIEIYDMQGCRVLCNKLNNNVLNVSGLSCGMYFVHIFTNRADEVIVNKFLKK